MNANILVVDDFYNNPEEVRTAALNSEFSVRGNFPGQRTVSHLNDSVKETIQKLILPFGGRVTRWCEDQYTGSYQYTTSEDTSWVHCDNFNTWAGVCYLTPDAPHNSGTALFMHKETGAFRKPNNQELADRISSEGADPSKWIMTDVVSNKYNRLVMYRGDFYHSSMLYFGHDKFTGRLFQTFFFNTEY